ncbi:MAG: outer membrane beta-barrel protein, partial [Thiohalomonadales bacterium]
MINTSKFRFLLTIASVLLLYGFNNLALASNLSKASDRKGRWEASILTRYIDSTDINFNGGAQAKLSDEWAFGFDVGYNFSENLALNFDVSWTDVDYKGTRIDDTGSPSNVSGRITTNNVNFRATYNFSKRRFTPFIGASIGWMFVDSNVADGPPSSVCWWDPWWGYICSGYQP